MEVGIKRITPQSAIDRYIQQCLKVKELHVVNTLIDIGNRVVSEIRKRADYDNYTGNLRTSTRCGVVLRGKLIYTSPVKLELPTALDGYRDSENLLHKIADKYPFNSKNTLALIVVAGMHYASLVSANGRDVLDSGYILSKHLISKLLR